MRRGREENEGSSKSNRAEAEAVARAVGRFLEAGVRPHELGVVTPYAVRGKVECAAGKDGGMRMAGI